MSDAQEVKREFGAFEPRMPLLCLEKEEQSPVRLLPLGLDMQPAFTEQQVFDNLVASQTVSPYVRFNELLESQNGTVSLCGAGPSLRETYKELQGHVIACNSAVGWLLEHDVVPKYAMIFDAHPVCEHFAVPHPDVTYLIASRCHQAVFKRLEGCRIVVWHAHGDNIHEWLSERNILEPVIAGGSCAVTRGMYVALALGYKDLRIHGADSSYADDGSTHVIGKSLMQEKDINLTIGNHDGTRVFRSTPEWAAQVEEFKSIYPFFLDLGVKVRVHGDGMLPHVYRLMKASFDKFLAEQKISQPLEGTS